MGFGFTRRIFLVLCSSKWAHTFLLFFCVCLSFLFSHLFALVHSLHGADPDLETHRAAQPPHILRLPCPRRTATLLGRLQWKSILRLCLQSRELFHFTIWPHSPRNGRQKNPQAAKLRIFSASRGACFIASNDQRHFFYRTPSKDSAIK